MQVLWLRPVQQAHLPNQTVERGSAEPAGCCGIPFWKLKRLGRWHRVGSQPLHRCLVALLSLAVRDAPRTHEFQLVVVGGSRVVGDIAKQLRVAVYHLLQRLLFGPVAHIRSKPRQRRARW